MDGPKSPLSFLAANVKREMCWGPILLCLGIKITGHSGENMLVVSAKVAKGFLFWGFVEVQCSDFQTFKSLLNI